MRVLVALEYFETSGLFFGEYGGLYETYSEEETRNTDNPRREK